MIKNAATEIIDLAQKIQQLNEAWLRFPWQELTKAGISTQKLVKIHARIVNS